MAVGGSIVYPSLNTIANLARSLVNDDQQGATGTPGEGQILTNSSVTLQNFMNSAVRDMYRDVRIMGQPTLIKDNYILLGLTPINSPLGVGVPNPAVQAAIQYTGYFDGLEMNSNLTLPADMILPLEMWERLSGTNNPFAEVHQSSGPLRARNQVQSFGEWEWRTDSIWLNGATTTRDVRLRYISTFADLASPAIDWTTTYVPVMDCQEAVADKIAVMYAKRLGGGALADQMMSAKMSLFKLRQQVTRDRQKINYKHPMYAEGAGANAAAAYLY